MAKSVRSKWKKAHKRLRVLDERKNLLKRVGQLNSKLKLVQKGGISKVPSEEPEKRFHFSNPHVNAKERMTLAPMTTSAFGKSDPTAPHPTTYKFETLPGWMPAGGTSMSYADRDKLAEYEAEKFQKAQLAAAAAAAEDNDGVAAADEEDDGPVEITFGGEEEPVVKSVNKLKSMVHQKNEFSGSKKMPAAGVKKRMVSSTGTKRN